MDKQLTRKQQDFCINYIKNGCNAHDAALSAGYSESYACSRAHELIEHPIIKKRIGNAYNRTETKLDISWEWKAMKLQRVVNKFIPDDNSTPLTPAEARVAIMALSELNAMAGDYAPDKRLSVTVNATKEKLAEVKRIYKEY